MVRFNSIFTKNNRITTHDASLLAQSGERVDMVLPLSIGITDRAEWTFPIEPLISLSGKNIIVKRNVAKSEMRGTIKERWAEDDFHITIQGSFVHPDLYTYPEKDVQRLMQFIRHKKQLYVKNELFAMLDIHYIVIESYAFPFSKGENVQNYIIDAYSDDLSDLFIDVRDV